MSVLGEHNVVVVGATGAVGQEALAILAARGVPAHRVRALASARSAGASIKYGDAALRVEELTGHAFKHAQVALFCATSGVAKQWAKQAVEAGCTVIDNSSAFRADPTVPLVVPEVNGDWIPPSCRLIANPNCSTIIMLTALEPLRRLFGVERISVATYQAVSGAGASAMQELLDQARDVLDGRVATPRVFDEPCAFNVFSHNASVDVASGLNGEEAKMISESRRIWDDPGLLVSPTCVRVSVLRAHTQAITVTLQRPATESAIRQALARAPGVAVIDDRAHNRFPTPLKASGGDDVLVGRLRMDPADNSGRSWCVLVSADQLRKGAALNAIQIAEQLLEPNKPATTQRSTVQR